MKAYYRPIITDPSRPAHSLAGGWSVFSDVERITREGAEVVPADAIPTDILDRLCAPRADLQGVALDRPNLMGIVNVTPDSFSDGGLFQDHAMAIAHARQLVQEGATILDIGGESTRPGATPVSAQNERARVMSVIEAVRDLPTLVSIDTRSAAIAEAAHDAGARLFNDVSALTHDTDSLAYAARSGMAVCLMHARGTPQTMQNDTRYDNVVLDVYDMLEARVAACVAAGIPRSRILVDPGIGFGKTLVHNIALIRGISLFHGLGCGILVGLSRKRFIGTLSGDVAAQDRVMGSVTAGLACLRQGVQILRVHDVSAHRQAFGVWSAIEGLK